MKESLHSRWLRWRFNFYPAYRRTGARVMFASADYHHVKIRLPLNWKTKNHNGTIFGGSLYAALDGVYVMMLFFILNDKKVKLWTKKSTIEFKQPGRSELYADFNISSDQINEIISLLCVNNRVDYNFQISLYDHAERDVVHVEQVISIRK